MKRLVTGSVLILIVAVVSACDSVSKSGQGLAERIQADVADQRVQDFQLKLLNLAFNGVSEMPLRPHIKNRSRAQLNIVEACIELGQPGLAQSYLDQIANWRRWMGTADLAFYLAENGYGNLSRQLAGTVQPALQAAEDIRRGRTVAATPNALVDTLEDWRYQAVLSRIAEVHLLNGTVESIEVDEEKYGEINASVLGMGMLSDTKDAFDSTLNSLRAVAEDPNFEIVHLGLVQMAELVGENYDQISLSEFVEENVSSKLNRQMPVFLRMDILLQFANAALKNSDTNAALSLLDQVEEMAETLKSSPRVYIPEKARLVQVKYFAGELGGAEDGLQSMISVFNEKRDLIVNIERADLLCRIAETAFSLGHHHQALTFYRQAVAEGQVNPNSRPQAEDLERICRSMALHAIEPTADLWSALKLMRDGLGAPW
ncbi:hypothetical protein [Tichowtungia aerotolerans]|uniref:Tetratricopeptide repeat protein n=1 Tax=Tichowtungia aerotolerans TaxID=2697043 RepID=A0A6P1M827_9BACT|nr:hypothetical protein [Tichowtungia aerotolerans]QHI70037.1 hypothetical protein GT409_11450 [Tichowtungia aerotolerans]